MKAKLEKSYKITLDLDDTEAEIVKTALEVLCGETIRSRVESELQNGARPLYEQLSDKLNEIDWSDE